MTALPNVLVTPKGVWFDGQEIPWFIAENGISFQPGGSDDFNSLTIEFIVGDVVFWDSWGQSRQERWDMLARLVVMGSRYHLREFDRIIKEYNNG